MPEETKAVKSIGNPFTFAWVPRGSPVDSPMELECFMYRAEVHPREGASSWTGRVVHTGGSGNVWEMEEFPSREESQRACETWLLTYVVAPRSSVLVTLDQVAHDIYDAWARAGDAAYFEREWRGPFTDIGHPMSNNSAIRIACQLIGAWEPGRGYGGVVHERHSHRFVIVDVFGLVPCPCGGTGKYSPKMPGYPCPRCADEGRVKPDPDEKEST